MRAFEAAGFIDAGLHSPTLIFWDKRVKPLPDGHMALDPLLLSLPPRIGARAFPSLFHVYAVVVSYKSGHPADDELSFVKYQGLRFQHPCGSPCATDNDWLGSVLVISVHDSAFAL